MRIAPGGLFRRLTLIALLGVAFEVDGLRSRVVAEAGEDAVVLEEKQEVEFVSESEVRIQYLNRTQVRTPRGAEQYGDAWVGYDPSLSLRELHASVTSTSGKRTEVKKSTFSDSSDFEDFEAYSDARKRGIHFPGVVPGDILEYGYSATRRDLLFTPRFFLQREIPARSLVFVVKAPASLALSLSVRGSPAYQKTESGGTVTHQWEARDVPAFRTEADIPPEEDLLPRVAVYPQRLSYGEHRISADSWDGIARWSHDLFMDRMNPDPAVMEAAKSVTAGAKDPEERVRLLYEFLQRKIRYVAVELGIGGWQPHDNGQVFLHQYGDCKDKAALLIAMMRAVGITGSPVLIRTRDAGLLERDHPAAVFNHVIVGLPRPEGYLFLDPTSESTPYGDLPWNDQGVPALVVKADGSGDLVETPLTPPDRNQTHRRVDARITETGALEGEYSVEFAGRDREAIEEFLQNGKTSDRQDALEQVMAGLHAGSAIKTYRFQPAPRRQDPVKVIIQFELPRYVLKAGSTELISPVLVRFPQFSELTSSNRRFPTFFPELFEETSEVRLRLPPGRAVAKVPSDRRSDCPGIQAETKYRLERDDSGQTLIVSRSLIVSRREISPSEYPSLKEFLSGLAREDAGAVSLVPAP